MKNTAHDLRLRLAASTVDSVKGTITGATVAKANVPAIGKYIFQRADGSLTTEAEGSVKKLGVATDDQTLATLMTAINQAGGGLRFALITTIRLIHASDTQPRFAMKLIG